MTTPQEPKGVVIADDRLPEGEYKLQKTYRIYEDGVWRELKLRVARGVIRDVKQRREPRQGREL